MADNVTYFGGITRLDLDPAQVLDRAAARKFERVLIIGITDDGAEFFASSAADGGTAIWDMERCRHKLMQIADAEQAP